MEKSSDYVENINNIINKISTKINDNLEKSRLNAINKNMIPEFNINDYNNNKNLSNTKSYLNFDNSSKNKNKKCSSIRGHKINMPYNMKSYSDYLYSMKKIYRNQSNKNYLYENKSSYK